MAAMGCITGGILMGDGGSAVVAVLVVDPNEP
jgi:hypothetical protein